MTTAIEPCGHAGNLETWRAAFLAAGIAHAGEPSIVLTPAELAQLRPVAAAARQARICLQCDPDIPEVWYPIGTAPHLASSHGQVRSPGKILAQRPMNRPAGDGPKYQKWDQTIAPGQRVTRLVHASLLTAFEGERPAGNESCHLDDIPDHNHWCNLMWGPPDLQAVHKAAQARYRTAAARAARSEHSRRSRQTDLVRREAAAERDRKAVRDTRSPLRRLLRRVSAHAPWRGRGGDL